MLQWAHLDDLAGLETFAYAVLPQFQTKYTIVDRSKYAKKEAPLDQ
jgi:hypothetical protein